METKIIILLLLFAVINLVSAGVCAYDKQKAKWGGNRISENMLMVLALIGGATAMYITMIRIRHKTKHMKFMIGLPVIIVAQAMLIVVAVSRYL